MTELDPDSANRPSRDDNPALHFLNSHRQSEWKILNYLEANRNDLVADAGFERVCRSWVAALTKLKGDSAVSTRKRNIATTLLNRYKNAHQDHDLARAFRDLVRSTDPKAVAAKPSVVINRSFLNNTTFSVNSPAGSSRSGQKRKSTSKDDESKRQSKRPALVLTFLKHFAACFEKMSRSRKWTLPSGVCVEDTLFERFKNASEECAVHSWIIDPRDSAVKDCFTDEDWESICAKIPPLPNVDAEFVKSIMQYSTVGSVEKLRDLLDTTGPLTFEELPTLTSSKRAARCWAYDVLRAWVTLCSSPSTFTHNHRELWYVVNFWNTVFDKCMLSIPGAYMSRGESKSISTAARKNLDPSKRRRVGRLYDGILSIHEQEVGAAEHARAWAGESQRKWILDSFKVVKVLHDMMAELQVPGAQVIGLVTAGWRCQLLRMVYAGGYLCLVGADAVRKVPTPSEGVAPLLELLVMVWKMKGVLGASDIVIEPTAEQLKERLMNLEGTLVAPPKVTLIPRSVETDDDLELVDRDAEANDGLELVDEDGETDDGLELVDRDAETDDGLGLADQDGANSIE